MKKLNYFLTLAAGAMMMASCSHDKEIVEAVDNNAVQQIVLQVASNGDGLTTRAGRPLLSDEAAQDIQNVKLYIVKNSEEEESEVVAIPDVDWKNPSPYDYGKYTIVELRGNKQLSEGKYTIYAIGYSDNTEYTLPNIQVGSSKSSLENMALDFKGTKGTAEEIFAGAVDFEVKTANFNQTIVLHRQVAGTYFYVYNLPYLDGNLTTECMIQLVSYDSNDQLVLGKFQTVDHGTDGSAAMYVVNGKKSESYSGGETVLCTETIGDWYTSINDENKDGVVDVENNWIGSNGKREGGYVKGSIFGSSFVMPFKSQKDSQTLKLRIVKSDNTLVYSWNVNMKTAPTAPNYFDAGNTDDKWPTSNLSESVNNYSIVRNHLYSVGVKAKTNPKEPTDPDEEDPDDPDPDDPEDEKEDPEDISKVQSLTLKVNHNWEVIHRMELE